MSNSEHESHCSKAIILSFALVSFIVNWVIHFYHFPHVPIVRLIIFITAGRLENISNIAYNISDPSKDKYLQKEGFACYENMICLFCNLSDVFICVSKSFLL